VTNLVSETEPRCRCEENTTHAQGNQ